MKKLSVFEMNNLRFRFRVVKAAVEDLAVAGQQYGEQSPEYQAQQLRSFRLVERYFAEMLVSELGRIEAEAVKHAAIPFKLADCVPGSVKNRLALFFGKFAGKFKRAELGV